MFQRILPVAGLLLAFLVSSSVCAQLPQIRLNALYPQGGMIGSTFRVTLTDGPDSDEVSELLFAHPGMTAVVAKNDAGAEIANAFDVTIAGDVPAGYYDVRTRGLFGVSNPRIFRVDSLPEVAEAEPNNASEAAQKVAVNQIVNARSNAASDIDVFHVDVDRGQTITVRTEAARIDSLMQPIVQVLDDTGRRIAQSRRALDEDASIVVTSERAQTLTIRVHDIVYAGGNPYSYRLTVDTRPLVDFVWPPVVAAGSPSAVVLYGRHLPEGEPTEWTLRGSPLYRQPYLVDGMNAHGPSIGSPAAATAVDTEWWSGIAGNVLRLAVGRPGVPIYRDSAPITGSGQLMGSFTVSGRFGARGHASLIRFQAKKGDVREIEVLSQRLGVPGNSLLHIEQVTTAEDGTETVKLIASEVDGRQNPGGPQLPTFTTDSAYRLTAPADGVYQLRLIDRYAKSQPIANRLYVLHVQEPQSGFDLIAYESIASADGTAPVTTGAMSIRRGGHYEVPVYVLRRGGHNAAITVTATDLPAGVSCLPATIHPGKSSTRLLLQAADGAPETTVPIRITGTSGDISQDARTATLLHGATNGLPRTGRIASSLVLNVMKDNQPFTVKFGLSEAVMHQDQQLLIPVTLTRRDGFNGKVDVAFAGQPGNVDAAALSFAPDITSLTAKLFFKENAAAGAAQLLAYATGPVKYRRNPWKAERAHAHVATVQQQAEAQQKLVAEATANAERVTAEIKTATDVIATAKAQQEATREEVAALKQKAAVATGDQSAVLAALRKLQEAQLAAATSAENADVDPSALQTASDNLKKAAEELARASAEVAADTDQLNGAVAKALMYRQQRANAETDLAAVQVRLEMAQAAAAAAQKKQEQLTAEKAKADEAAKAADESTKPADVNVRQISTLVELQVFATPGKITAAVPDGGAIKRGTSIEVPVTIDRKNGFAGAVTVALEIPESSGISAAAVEIPADQTQGKILIAAKADAAVAEISHVVLRANTPDFKGRPASFDVPIPVKVTE